MDEEYNEHFTSPPPKKRTPATITIHYIGDEPNRTVSGGNLAALESERDTLRRRVEVLEAHERQLREAIEGVMPPASVFDLYADFARRGFAGIETMYVPKWEAWLALRDLIAVPPKGKETA